MIVDIEEIEEPKRQTDHRGNLCPTDWADHKRRVTSGPYEAIRYSTGDNTETSKP